VAWSLEEQLLLLGSALFEELCGQIIRQIDPSAQHLYGKGGDEGIDVRAGELDPDLRAASGTKLTIWQVKFFRDGIKDSQRMQVESSFKRALTHKPERWVLCVPRPLTVPEAKWWDEFKADAELTHPQLELDIWPGDAVVNRLTPALRDSYFQTPSQNDNALTRIERHLSDFYPVKEKLSRAHELNLNEPKPPVPFYGGTQADWRDIDRGFDVPRCALGPIWRFLATKAPSPSRGRIPFVLLSGRSGDGKSTLLLRLAAELVRHEVGLVLMQKEDHATLEVDDIEELGDRPIYLFIDSLTRFSEDVLRALFVRLQQSGQRVTVVGSAIRSLWSAMTHDLKDLVDTHESNLEELEDVEIDDLIDRLERWGIGGTRGLGALAGKSRETRLRLFRKANRQLLVALLEIQGGESIEAHLRNELDQLGRRTLGDAARKAVIFVAALHRFDLRMPMPLLVRLLPNCDVKLDILSRTEGLLVLTEDEDTLRTRHALVANSLFRAEKHQEEFYKRLLNATTANDVGLIGQLIENLNRVGADYSLRLTQQAASLFPYDPQLNIAYAIGLRRAGRLAEARVVFAAVNNFDSSVSTWLSNWAVRERVARNIGTMEEEFTARWLFHKALEKDFNNVFTLQRWALLERDMGNVGSIEEEFTARWLFHRAYKAYPRNRLTLSAWGLLERVAGNIGGIEEEFTARWLFQRAYLLGSDSAVVLQEWSVLERDARNIGTIDQEFTARWLFRKAYEKDPTNSHTLQAWGILERDAGNIGTMEQEFSARWLFRKAFDQRDYNVFLLHPWAILERKQGNIGTMEEEFTARWLFRKAYDQDGNDVFVLQAWAILERDVGNIGTVDEEFTARWLFRTADEKDPDNVIIVHPWAMMERKQGNLEASTALLERAARLQGDARDRCRTYYDLGMILHWAGQRERAHGYFALAVDANPRDWRAQAAFARSLGYQRQWGLAEYHFALSLSVKEARRTLEWRDRMRATRLRIVTTKA